MQKRMATKLTPVEQYYAERDSRRGPLEVRGKIVSPTTINIPPAFKRCLKTYCAFRRVKMGQYLLGLAEKHMKRDQKWQAFVKRLPDVRTI